LSLAYYLEPFCGGASCYWLAASQGLHFFGDSQNAVLNWRH
jgi:site-specific DNA-adenine methylase